MIFVDVVLPVGKVAASSGRERKGGREGGRETETERERERETERHRQAERHRESTCCSWYKFRV